MDRIADMEYVKWKQLSFICILFYENGYVIEMSVETLTKEFSFSSFYEIIAGFVVRQKWTFFKGFSFY